MGYGYGYCTGSTILLYCILYRARAGPGPGTVAGTVPVLLLSIPWPWPCAVYSSATVCSVYVIARELIRSFLYEVSYDMNMYSLYVFEYVPYV